MTEETKTCCPCDKYIPYEDWPCPYYNVHTSECEKPKDDQGVNRQQGFRRQILCLDGLTPFDPGAPSICTKIQLKIV